MKNRTLPYGYEVRKGAICANASEAEIVRGLFRDYAEGRSFRELALRLQGDGIPYHEGDASWTKNKVARIINSAVYLGREKYPPLIGKDLYDRAAARKPPCGMTEETSKAKALWQISRCACCGGWIRVIPGKTGWNRWNCSRCGRIGAGAVTGKILPRLEEIWHGLINGRYEIEAPPDEPARNAELAEKETAFDALLDEDGFDEKVAMAAAMELAAMRYGYIGSADYETERIRYMLRDMSLTAEMDVEVLRSVASAILIYPDGNVSVQLANEQILEGMREDEGNSPARHCHTTEA